MPTHTQSRNAAQESAQHFFRIVDLRPDALAKQMRKKERAASAANTARLRELRLAKEAAEKQAAENGAALRPKPVRAVRSVVRMTY